MILARVRPIHLEKVIYSTAKRIAIKIISPREARYSYKYIDRHSECGEP
jgi:hypothetical protein